MTSLTACTQVERLKSGAEPNYASPQEFIAKKNLNNQDGTAKDYIYVWDAKQKGNSTQSLIPRTTLSQYCHTKSGRLVLSYKSQLSLVKNTAQKRRLAADKSLAQGIGAYQCKFADGTHWLVSIEPMSEQAVQKNSATRSVKLLTKVMSMHEARQFYRGAVSLDKKIEAPKTSVKNTPKAVAKKRNEFKRRLKRKPKQRVKANT